MRLAYFDCFSGIGGDMTLGALIDAGLPLSKIEKRIAKLKLKGYKLSARKVKRGSIVGTKFECSVSSGITHHHRSLKDIIRLIENSALTGRVKDISKSIFNNLGKAESLVHGLPVSSVRFHEVGAIDSIVDIVGVSVAIDELDIGDVYASRVNIGSGTVKAQHGTLPVPGPAALELLKDIPVRIGRPEFELVTPTGAAILKTLAKGFGDSPVMKISNIGYGAGSEDITGMPNMLRIVIGQSAKGGLYDKATVIECNVDDSNPQILGYTLERLMEAGALDAYITPIHMKKSRPAFKLSVICEPAASDRMQKIIFTETSTFGLRRYETERVKLDRKLVETKTRFGRVRVKVGRVDNGLETVSAEYEDCAKLARARKVPIKNVMDNAIRTYKEKRG